MTLYVCEEPGYKYQSLPDGGGVNQTVDKLYLQAPRDGIHLTLNILFIIDISIQSAIVLYIYFGNYADQRCCGSRYWCCQRHWPGVLCCPFRKWSSYGKEYTHNILLLLIENDLCLFQAANCHPAGQRASTYRILLSAVSELAVDTSQNDPVSITQEQ